MKKVLATVLALVMALALLPTAVFAATDTTASSGTVAGEVTESNLIDVGNRRLYAKVCTEAPENTIATEVTITGEMLEQIAIHESDWVYFIIETDVGEVALDREAFKSMCGSSGEGNALKIVLRNTSTDGATRYSVNAYAVSDDTKQSEIYTDAAKNSGTVEICVQYDQKDTSKTVYVYPVVNGARGEKLAVEWVVENYMSWKTNCFSEYEIGEEFDASKTVNANDLTTSGSTVTVSATTSSRDASSTEVTVEADAVAAIQNSGATSVVLTTDVGDITLDADAISAMSKGLDSGDNLKLTVSKAEKGDTTAYFINAYAVDSEGNKTPLYTDDGEHGGTVTVTVDYDKKDNSKKVTVYYVNGERKQAMPTSYENGKLTWTTSHFSRYEPVEENRSTYKRTNTGVDTNEATSPKTFDAGVALYVGMALTSVAGSAVVIGKKKEF